MRFYKPNKGVTLPTLTNPAGPDSIVLDKEAINGSGQKVVGKLDIAQAFTVNGGVEIPLQTFEVIGGIKVLKVAGSLGNATASDIVKGKNAFTDAGFVEGTLEATGGEPSYNFDIASENASDGVDKVIYYTPGSSEKSSRQLTSVYQSIFCGDFLCIIRGSKNNVTSNIYFLDGNDARLLTVSSGVNAKYGVNVVPNARFSTINIRAIKRDYPTVSKIMLKYMD